MERLVDKLNFIISFNEYAEMVAGWILGIHD